MKNSFDQILIKDSNIIIEVEIKKKIKKISTNQFIKNYKISNFWKGKFFIKRLIKKIFKYQLSDRMLWNKNFWDVININLFETEIRLNENINRLPKEIKKSVSEKRFYDIIKYKELILKNIELGYPLYIHSSCLNFLGAKIKNDGYYILDGSRRLSAHILAQNNPSILVINLNE